MSKRIIKLALLSIAAFFITFTACNGNENETPQIEQVSIPSPKSQPIVKVETFKVPANSVINLDKAKTYAKASGALVELGVKWSERIDNASDNEKVQILNAYNVARDQLCARIGLAGIAEFDWITTFALQNPKNKSTFEAVGVRPNI